MTATTTPRWIVPAAAAMGLVSGFVAGYFRFPIPDYQIDIGTDSGLVFTQVDWAPATAPILFSVGMVLVLWRVSPRRAAGLLLGVPAGIFVGWFLAVNIAVQLVANLAGGDTETAIDVLVWLLSGAVAGLVGAVLTGLGASAAFPRLRNRRPLLLTAAAGAVFGLLLYPAIDVVETIWVLFAPWQAAVACAIAWSLSRRAE